MPEKIIDYENVIHERLKNIIESKRSENEAAVGTLKALESSWDDLNQSLKQEINAEFDLMVLEEQAIERARGLLRKNCAPIPKDAFLVAGKVIDAEIEVGLPGMLVKIVQKIDQKEIPITEAETDRYGNFTVTISSENLDVQNQEQQILTFIVLSDPETVVHSEDKAMQIKPGKRERVTIAIPCGTNLPDWLEGGKVVRDSIERDAEVVNLRLTNMKVAHTAVSRLAAVSLEDVKILSEELSIAPPSIPSLDDKPEEEIPEEPDPDKWIVRGQVTDENDQGIGGLIVSVYDEDCIFDDRLGSTLTDENGYFMLNYRTEDFRDLIEAKPDIYLKVLDKEGKTLYTSEKAVRYEAGHVEAFDIGIGKTKQDESPS